MYIYYSSLGKSGIFEKVESAGELERDLSDIVEWGNRWLVTFNATKTKLLSFNRHRDPLLVPVKMSSTELHEENLVGKELCAGLLTLSHRRNVVSLCLLYNITIVNVLLSLLIWYLPSESLFEALVFLSRCIVIRWVYQSVGLGTIPQAFFLEPQPFGTPSPMNAFQQITISQHSRGGSISFCCSSNL